MVQTCDSLRHDVAILRSIPGVGRIITAALITEAFDALSQRDYDALRAHGGTAPVTRRSGKSTHIVMRYGCNQRFRTALYHWARTSVMHEERSKHHYARLRGAGTSMRERSAALPTAFWQCWSPCSKPVSSMMRAGASCVNR